jgi:hypothetical protein
MRIFEMTLPAAAPLWLLVALCSCALPVDRPEETVERSQAMNRISLKPTDGSMQVLVSVPGLEDEPFILIFPETIGARDDLPAHKEVKPQWESLPNGGFGYTWHKDGWVHMRAELLPGSDFVDMNISIKNLSEKTWNEVFAFNCLSPGAGAANAPPFQTPQSRGTFLVTEKGLTDIQDIAPHKGPNPKLHFIFTRETIDLPRCNYESFQNSHDTAVTESFIATVSQDGKWVIAMGCKQADFLFQNDQFTCIHASPFFGDLKPGEEKSISQRAYFAESSLEEIYDRYRREFGVGR